MDTQTAPSVARRGALVVIGFQYAFVVLFAFGALVPLLAAAVATGDYAGLADPGLERYGDPKDHLPGSAWNPLLWIVVIGYVMVLYGVAVPLGLLTAAAGAIHVAARWRDVSRGVRAWELTGTVLAAAVAVLMLTPYGVQLRYWLLD
ncbi:hypothetical protein [Catellatospora sp. NPDC049609]|uniref:hypothetical protein n=1 Tax=Catellatospora sp. NPDC049609 TaxID=3155505 RepID=UPI003425C382